MTDRPVEAELFGSLFVLAQHLTRRADAEIALLGLTSRQWLLLAVLDARFPDGPPTLSEAAAAYGSSRQNVKQIALQLERGGWLRLLPDPADGRVTRLALTDRVEEFHDPARVAADLAFLDDLFGALTDRQRRTMLSLVTRCIEHLEENAS